MDDADKELVALTAVWDAVRELNSDAIERIIEYIRTRHSDEDRQRAATKTQA